MSHGAGSGGGGRPETFIITYGAGDMSNDLANAMRTALMQEMARQGKTSKWIRSIGAMDTLFGEGEMLVSTAQRIAAALGCHWEARLIHGTQPLSEGVALVRDTDP